MDDFEKQVEIPLDKKDNEIVNGLKKEFKKSLLINICSCLGFSFVMPYLFKQARIEVLNEMPYFYRWLLGFMVCVFLGNLKHRALFTYIKKFNDFKDEKKVILETRIKAIVHLKSQINVSVTDTNYQYTGFQVINERCYENPAINDEVKLYFLPRTKIVLEMQRK